MSIRSKLVATAVLAGFTIGVIQLPAQKKNLNIPDPGRLQPVRKASGALGSVLLASQALGMQRRLGQTHGVDGFLFIANGKLAEVRSDAPWPEYKVTKLAAEGTYYNFSQGVARSPGTRADYSLIDSSGKTQRRILVAAGDDAWNEVTPGGSATSAKETASDRLLHLWLTPHGLIWAALTGDGKDVAKGVTMTQEGGKTVLTIPLNGVPAKVTLNADNRPEKVEAQIKHPVLGDTSLEIDYSGYRDFERAYWVYFPAHIVEKLGGRTVQDLTVTEFHTNPYVVFPVPSNVQSAAK